MLRKIAGTIGTRVVTALLAFVTWTLNAHFLGPEKVGTISLMIFSVAIIQLFTNFVAGAALIYQTPRAGVYRLIIPAYCWSLIVTALMAFLLELAGRIFPVVAIIPEGYFLPVLFLAQVMSLASANNMFLLGLERIRAYNIAGLIQITVLLLVLLLLIFGSGMRDVMAYYWAIFSSWLLVMVITLGMLAPHIRREPLKGLGTLMKEILRFGAYVQFANFFQTLNYRLSLKFTDLFLGRGSVGVLSLGMQLAEGLWIISRSIATVQFSKLANEKDREYGVNLTLALAKAALLITAVAMLALIAIPGSVFVFLFSAGFAQVKLVIASLAIGIVALSVSMILSGFFSGINRPWHNTVSSAIGLIFTVLMGLFLIPSYGIAGAGLAATVSYSIATLYQFVVFLRVGKVRAKDLLITRAEILTFVGEMKRIFT